MILLNEIKDFVVRTQKLVLATSDKQGQLVVTKTNGEISEIYKKILCVTCVIWIFICLLYGGISYFQKGKIDFNIIFVAYPILMIGATLFFNLPKHKFNKLLRDIVERLNLTSALNQKIRIEYTRSNEKTVIKLFSVIPSDKADLLIREIASYFQRHFRKPFIIDDYEVQQKS